MLSPRLIGLPVRVSEVQDGVGTEWAVAAFIKVRYDVEHCHCDFDFCRDKSHVSYMIVMD